MYVNNREQNQPAIRRLALNKPAVVGLSRSEGMKTKEPSRSNSSRDNSGSKKAAVPNTTMMNTKVKVTLKKIYQRSINSKCKSTSPNNAIKPQIPKVTPQKSTKK